MHEHKELPSGKQIMKRFDADGRVASESHTYGMLDIGITIEFHEGVKTGEMYFVNKRLVSRKRYDNARADYADMPPPDSALEDFGAELVKDAQAERRQRAKVAIIKAMTHVVNFRMDGTAPTAAAGMQLAVGDYWVIEGYQNIKNFRCIDTGAGASEVRCLFFF